MTDHPRDLVEDFDQTEPCPNALFENSDEEFLLQDEDDEDSGDDEACRDDNQTGIKKVIFKDIWYNLCAK